MTLDQPAPCSDISVLENDFWFSFTRQAQSEHLGGPGSVLDTKDIARRLSPAQRSSEATKEAKERISDLTLAGKVALLFCLKMRHN